MNYSARVILSLACSTVFFAPQISQAWGGRGHHLIGEMAAIAIRSIADGEGSTDFIRFFQDQNIPLGHVSDIPDLTWKNRDDRPRITGLNIPTHYLDTEFLLGEPSTPLAPYLERIRKLPDNYSALLSRFEGQSNPLPAIGETHKRLLIFEEVGTAPWRAQQLYDLLVSAFRCARSKETGITPKPSRASPFQLPSDSTGQAEDPPLPTYQCLPSQPRDLDLEAIVVLSGLLSHFLADLGMPYHPTANFDGWVTGNGGIHSYLEVEIVNALDQNLSVDVLKQAENKLFQTSLWKKVDPAYAQVSNEAPTLTSTPASIIPAGILPAPKSAAQAALQSNGGVARLALGLASDSYSHIASLAALDEKVAVLKKSKTLKWGDSPYNYPRGALTPASRRPAESASVLRAFRPLIVERLAASTYLIARTWFAAWDAGGRPKLAKLAEWQLRYPVDPPFIWPDYDPAAISRSKK